MSVPGAGTSAKLPVLIFGPHITALGVLRVLTAHNVRCYVVDETTDIITRSRWYRPAERTLAETTSSDELAAYLEGLNLERAVLIPCSDRWTRAVAGLPELTRQRFPSSVPASHVIDRFVDKEGLRTTLDEVGVPHPRTWRLSEASDLEAVPDADLRAGFLKPTSSQLHGRLFGRKGTFVKTRSEARALLEVANAHGFGFVLQEWIPGDASKTILLDGFVDQSGTVVSMMARRRIRMKPPSLSNTASSVTIPLDEVAEATESARRLADAVGFRGIFNIEFKHDQRDGHFKFIELNPRPFWFIAHIAKSGLDLPWMSYLDAQGLPVKAPPRYRPGRYALYELPDGAAIAFALRHFRWPEGSIMRPWFGDHLLFWWSDPLPAIADTTRAIRGGISRLGRKSKPNDAT